MSQLDATERVEHARMSNDRCQGTSPRVGLSPPRLGKPQAGKHVCVRVLAPWLTPLLKEAKAMREVCIVRWHHPTAHVGFPDDLSKGRGQRRKSIAGGEALQGGCTKREREQGKQRRKSNAAPVGQGEQCRANNAMGATKGRKMRGAKQGEQ